MKRWLILLAPVLLCVLGCSPRAADETAAGEKKLQLAVIPKGTTHIFWKSIHGGAAKAAAELDVEITWLGPEKEDDRDMQIQVVQNFISLKMDAIVLAPLDDTALVRPVKDAQARGIPVVIIDSGLNTDEYASFVATDNKEGGRMGARRLGAVMEGKGKALLLRYQVGSASTTNREEGFLEVMAQDFPDIELVSTNQYAGATKETALQASQNLLNKYPEIQGIFCPNESAAFGMLRALKNSGKAGAVKFVGFDTSEGLIAGMRDGEIHGLVSQDPFDMGYLGVKTAVSVIKGQPVEKRIPTRLAMITPDNMDDPEMVELMNPDLDRWLK